MESSVPAIADAPPSESSGEVVAADQLCIQCKRPKRVTQLRIGPEKQGFIYHLLEADTWQCVKGSDWAADGEKLVLKKSESDQHWTAFDVANYADADTIGVPVFRTSENPIEEGYHTWQANGNRSRSSPTWRDMGGAFKTTHLS